jgi:hypothetical protein
VDEVAGVDVASGAGGRSFFASVSVIGGSDLIDSCPLLIDMPSTLSGREGDGVLVGLDATRNRGARLEINEPRPTPQELIRVPAVLTSDVGVAGRSLGTPVVVVCPGSAGNSFGTSTGVLVRLDGVGDGDRLLSNPGLMEMLGLRAVCHRVRTPSKAL